MNLKELIRLVIPPVFIQLAKRMRGNPPRDDISGISGDYHSWEEARAASVGYDSDIILEKTKVALLKVKNREATYERDSVLFDKVKYSWPLLAGLMWAAARCGGKLNVLDFGGSLGSTFFQNRFFLSALPKVHWNIVEQPAHVKVGRELFEDEHLRFYDSVKKCLSESTPNVALLSSVLQYMEHPYALLTSLLKLPGICVIIDRTPYWNGDHDRLQTQRVRPEIFDASYPMWSFSLSKFKETFGCSATFVEFESFENGLFGLMWKGFIIMGAD